MNIQIFYKVCLSTLLMQTVCVYSAELTPLPISEDLKDKASHYTKHCTSNLNAFKTSLHAVLTNERFEAIREQLKAQEAP